MQQASRLTRGPLHGAAFLRGAAIGALPMADCGGRDPTEFLVVLASLPALLAWASLASEFRLCEAHTTRAKNDFRAALRTGLS